MHICIRGFLPSLSPLPSHQPFSFKLPLAADWVLKLGKGAARQNSPACRPVLWGGKALDCAAWEQSSGMQRLAGAHGHQPEASPQPPRQQSIATGKHVPSTYKHKQQNVPQGGQRNNHSLYADTLTHIIFSRKILSPSQDKLNYVYETTSTNK